MMTMGTGTTNTGTGTIMGTMTPTGMTLATVIMGMCTTVFTPTNSGPLKAVFCATAGTK
jgi:hypothetical protein